MINQDFIVYFFSKKEQELQLIIENDDWKEVHIPSIYQNMVNFISKEVFDEIKSSFFPLIFERLDETEKFETSTKDETSILLSNEKYKIISAMITFIKLLYDSEKLIYLCDKSFVPLISQSVYCL